MKQIYFLYKILGHSIVNGQNEGNGFWWYRSRAYFHYSSVDIWCNRVTIQFSRVIHRVLWMMTEFTFLCLTGIFVVKRHNNDRKRPCNTFPRLAFALITSFILTLFHYTIFTLYYQNGFWDSSLLEMKGSMFRKRCRFIFNYVWTISVTVNIASSI